MLTKSAEKSPLVPESEASTANRPVKESRFSPPISSKLGGEYIQSPLELRDLGGFSGFMREV
ncbi:MAG TPA: hypothetical protein V6C85_06655 [Allocoleopsis sp.]